jgi:hypothetical protein
VIVAAQAAANAQRAIALSAVANANANTNGHATGANPTAAMLAAGNLAVAANPAVAGNANPAPVINSDQRRGAEQRTPPIAAMVQNPRMWDTLVEDALLEAHTFTNQLAQENAAVTWDNAMAQFIHFLSITFLSITMAPGYTTERGQ